MAYYSIISVSIRPELQEKITLGLLLFDAENIFFNLSKNKLTASRALLTDDAYKLLTDSVKNIKSKAISENDLLGSKAAKQLSIRDEMLLNTFSPGYISYLSKYSNNILSFSEPKEINIQATDSAFRKLFTRFVDATQEIAPELPQAKSIELFKEQNLGRLKKHFNIDRKVSSREIPNLIMPVKVDLLGENGMPVFVQTIDMDRRTYDIEYDIGVLLSLNAAFTQNNKKAKGFVMAQEPVLKDKEQFAIWNELRKSPLFEYVDTSEGNKIIEYAEENNVHPLVEENGLANELDA